MRRLKACVEAWPDCIEGDYNPACCRFPKSCSCTVYDEQYLKEGDLEPLEPRTFEYGPGGEYLPDGKPRIMVQIVPDSLVSRLGHTIRCARDAWRSTRPTKR